VVTAARAKSHDSIWQITIHASCRHAIDAIYSGSRAIWLRGISALAIGLIGIIPIYTWSHAIWLFWFNAIYSWGRATFTIYAGITAAFFTFTIAGIALNVASIKLLAEARPRRPVANSNFQVWIFSEQSDRKPSAEPSTGLSGDIAAVTVADWPQGCTSSF